MECCNGGTDCINVFKCMVVSMYILVAFFLDFSPLCFVMVALSVVSVSRNAVMVALIVLISHHRAAHRRLPMQPKNEELKSVS